MPATAVRRPVEPPAEPRRLVLVHPAPAVPNARPKTLVCSWSVDPATGTVRARWGVPSAL
jgi:hypothetical protein